MNYSEDFTIGTANPLSGTNWYGGLADGLDWQNIQKGNGHAFAYASSLAVLSGDDCTAIAKGTWTKNQIVQATAVVNNSSRSQELELRLNVTVTPHNIKGYEIDIILGGGVFIYRWDGARDNATQVTGGTGGGPFSILDNGGAGPVATGSIFKAINVNGLISVYENIGGGFIFLGSGFDTTYTGGGPGIGVYLSNGSDTLPDVGWSAFSAQDDAQIATPFTSGIVGASYWRR